MLSQRIRLTRTNALYTFILLFLQPCGPCGVWYGADFNKTSDIKRSNVEITTENATASVRNYAELDLETGESTKVKGDKRLSCRAKGKKEPHTVVVHGPQGAGQFAAGLTVSIDDIEGLILEQTHGFGQVSGYADGPKEIAVTLAEILLEGDGEPETVLGLRACAFDDGVLEAFMDFPLATELDVRLVQDGTNLTWAARESSNLVGEGDEGTQPYEDIFSILAAPPLSYVFDSGVRTLGPKGEMFLDKFVFLGPDLGGTTEQRQATGQFAAIASCLEEVKTCLKVIESQVESGSQEAALSKLSGVEVGIGNAWASSQSLMFALESEVQNPDPQNEGSETKRALQQSTQLYRKLDKMLDLTDKIFSKSKITKGQVKALCKMTEQLIGRGDTGAANVQGYKAKSGKQLLWLSPLAERDVPPILGD